MREKIKITMIRERYLYGQRYSKGNRSAEVIRTDSCGHWITFYYQDGIMWCLQVRIPDTDKNGAIVRARRYVEFGTLPPESRRPFLVRETT